MLAGKILKMPGNFQEKVSLQMEDWGLKKKKKKKQKIPVIFNIFFLVFIQVMTTFESNDLLDSTLFLINTRKRAEIRESIQILKWHHF